MGRFALLAVLAIAVAAERAEAVPSTISFTGRLTTSAGPVSGAIGVTFRIYGTATGGTPLWTEVRTNLGASNGLVFVDLGEVTTLDTSVFTGDRRYLEIEVNGETLSPRLAMSSVPHAFRAAVAETLGGTIGSTDVITAAVGTNGVDAVKTGNTLGVSLSTTGCGTGSVWRYTGTAWQCTVDDELLGNEVVAATNTSLIRGGSGTSASPYTLALNTANANTWTATQTFESIVVGGRADLGWARVAGTAVNLTSAGSCVNWNVEGCNQATAIATCPSGLRVLGGGCTTSLANARDLNLSRSYPSADDTWTCSASSYGGAGAGTLTAYAICARL